jgi:hypothetical protein
LRRLGLERQPTERVGYERLHAALVARLGPEGAARGVSRGALLTEEKALELATDFGAAERLA